MGKDCTKMAGVSALRDQDEIRAQAARIFAPAYGMALRDMAAVLREVSRDVEKVLGKAVSQQKMGNRHE